ncbi:MAG: adenylate/guanylate cyclase domain-containing protein [Actinomycetota bacterium]
MFPTVRVVQPNRTQLYLVIAETVIIGRECDGLLLADEKVSRQHLSLSPGANGSVVVRDLGSTNGSFINQGRVEADSLLQIGATLTLGDTVITVDEPTPPSHQSSETVRQDVGGTIVATLPPKDPPIDPAATFVAEAPLHVPPAHAAPPAAPATPAAPPTPSVPPPVAPTPPPAPQAPSVPPAVPPAVPPVAPAAMPGVPPGARTSNEPIVRPTGDPADETRRTSMDEIAASLGSQPLNLNLPSGSADDTVTIMFSDIESSTEIALGMGDHRWYEVLTWHNNLIEQRVAAHGGFIVKNQGDGFMVTFNSSRRAIICASEIQQALHQHAVADPSSAIRVRIGLHTGEAIRQDSGDLFGRHVIIAARVGGLANGAEILVSSIVKEIASARGDLHFGEGAQVELKGVGQQTVYQVLWGAELPSA